MEDTVEFPISTLKVDFGCTNGCQTDVRKMLQELKGVKSISIDPKQGKVIVVGNVNPMMLIKLLQKMGKKAQLWSFDKEPKKKKASCSHAKQKHHSHHCHESSDTEDDSKTDHDHDHGHKHRTNHHQRSNKMHDQNNMFGFGNQHAPPPQGVGYQHEHAPPPPFARYQHAPQPPFAGYQHAPPPPMSGYNYRQPFSGHHNYHLPMPWHQSQHVGYARPPSMHQRSMPAYGGYHGHGQPMWPSYGHYGSRLPGHNPMIHYNNYADNYRYTI